MFSLAARPRAKGELQTKNKQYFPNASRGSSHPSDGRAPSSGIGNDVTREQTLGSALQSRRPMARMRSLSMDSVHSFTGVQTAVRYETTQVQRCVSFNSQRGGGSSPGGRNNIPVKQASYQSHCGRGGMVLSQTTLTPAVMSTTLIENVTGLTLTPAILSSTTPGCSAFNTSACEPCAPGSQYDNNTLMCACCANPGLCLFPGACLPCGTGFYQPLAGQQQCLPCNRGFYTNFTGSPLCHACPAGSFNNNTGGESCTSCSPGFFSSQQSSTSCSPCGLGTFCNSSGCPTCETCPGGTEALQTATQVCTQCRPGMYKTSHQTACQICSSGFYQIHWGQESCDVCPENHYCPSPDVNPIKCPSDAFCPAGSLAPGYCMETFFRKQGDTCELAPVTIALLVISGGVALLFIILMVLRRRRDTDRELNVARAPLLRKERPQGRYYGIPCDAEPVYAGW